MIHNDRILYRLNSIHNTGRLSVFDRNVLCEIIKETMTTDVTWKTLQECTDPTLIGLPQPYTLKTGAISTYGCHILQRVFNNMKPQAGVTTAYPYILSKCLLCTIFILRGIPNAFLVISKIQKCYTCIEKSRILVLVILKVWMLCWYTCHFNKIIP